MIRASAALLPLLLAAPPLAAKPTAQGSQPTAPNYPVELAAVLPPEGNATSAAAATLVGRSGQIYAPAGDLTWRRTGPGGIAADVLAAARVPGRPGEIVAGGRRTPPFRQAGGTWRADVLTNRGSMALARGGAVPALAAGRHIYVMEKGAWVRRAAAPRPVRALWAASPTSLLVATSDGALARLEGARLTPLKAPLDKDETVELLLGASARAVYGRTSAGGWIRLDRAGAARMSPDQALEGFEEHAAGLDPAGALLLAGTLPAPGGGRRLVLARADGNRLLAWETPGALAERAERDRVAVVWSHPSSGEILVASRSGAVALRARAGGWKTGRVNGALPARPGAAAGAGPARAR